MIAVRDVDGGEHQHRAQDVGQQVRARMIASGRTPMTRAACTYSLLRSTSVEPRTVRAYCTQFDSADGDDQHGDGDARRARSRGSATRATPSISSAIRIAGNESCTSATRMMNASTRPPR